MRDSQGCSHALLRTLSKQTPASGSYFLQVGYEPVCLKSRTLRTEQRHPLARQSRTHPLVPDHPDKRGSTVYLKPFTRATLPVAMNCISDNIVWYASLKNVLAGKTLI